MTLSAMDEVAALADLSSPVPIRVAHGVYSGGRVAAAGMGTVTPTWLTSTRPATGATVLVIRAGAGAYYVAAAY